MKTHNFIFKQLLLSLLMVVSTQLMGQESAIYGGGPIYKNRNNSINELRNSGFTTVIVWTIHIESNGDLGFNGEFPLVKNGVYVGNQQYPNFPRDIARLKTAPTSIKRVEFGLSSAGSGTYNNVRNFYNSGGFGPGTTLYKNFAALKAAIPAIDAFNNDDESTYHTASAVAFTKMLAGLGFKNAIVPFTNSGFWRTLVNQVNAAYPGNIDRNYLQCYAGGARNNPCSSSWNFGIPVYPGLWGGSGQSSTASVESRMNSWQNNCNIKGGFMWIYDDFDNSPSVAAYAAAINKALSPTGTPTPTPPPSNGATQFQYDVGTNTSVVWPRYIRLSNTTRAGSFGWTNTNGIGSRDRGAARGRNNINRDINFSKETRFFTQNLSNGNWNVLITFGDTYARRNMNVAAEGQNKLNNINTNRGQYLSRSFDVNVNDGKLDLRFSVGNGGDVWSITRIWIRKRGTNGVKFADEEIALDDAQLNSVFAIYPNPVNVGGSITVSGATVGTPIAIYNSIGQVVQQQIMTSENQKMSLIGLSSGIYFVNSNNGKSIQKLILVE